MKNYMTMFALLLANSMTSAQQPALKPVTNVVAGGKAASASIIKKDSSISLPAATNAPAIARPGSPIGGIVVKGGKNPGGSQMVAIADSSGQFELTIKEAGNYLFVLTAPVYTVSQSKSISEKGIKKAENPLYSNTGQTSENPLAKSAASIASPGNPIGGIIVKGGKNPGGSMLAITTTKNGELILNDLKAGNYRFTVTAP